MIVHRLSVQDLNGRMDAGQALLIIDVRDGFCDSDQMIPGAIHVDAHDLNPKLFNLNADMLLVVYDNKPHDEDATRVAEALQAAGFHAQVLQGGWGEWRKAGLSTEPRQERSLRKQIQEVKAAAQEGGQEKASSSGGAESATEEARERVQETAEGVATAVGDLASRALHLVQSLIRR